MFNEKLDIFTYMYKNTIYQSKLKLVAIFGQSRFSSTVRFSDRRHVHQRTVSARAQFIIQSSPDTNCLRTPLSPKYFVTTTFRFFGCSRWIFTHICSSLGEKFRFKTSDKIVDIARTPCFSVLITFVSVIFFLLKTWLQLEMKWKWLCYFVNSLFANL
jgi:hypothetical protein